MTSDAVYVEALEAALREMQGAAIEALGELDAPKVQISLCYERLVSAIDACDALVFDHHYARRLPMEGHVIASWSPDGESDLRSPDDSC